MFDCKVCLYCIGYIHNNIFFCSSQKEKFVPLIIELNQSDNFSMSDYILTLLDSYIGKKSKNIKPIILDIYKNKDKINMYYACILPLDTKLVNGYYIPYNIACLDPIAQKAMVYV